MRKACKHQQPLYMCFVDFKKAFDSIGLSHDKLWVTMVYVGYPLHFIDLVAKLGLYRKQGQSSGNIVRMVSC